MLTTMSSERMVPTMSTEKNMPRVTLLLPPKLLRRVDRFRYRNEIPNRNEAIRSLLEFALDEKGFKDDADAQQ